MIDVGTHGREHHVRRQRRFEMIEELRPRECPLIDECVRLMGSGRDDAELLWIDALANPRGLALVAVAFGSIALDPP
jgi:hypothetical protein